MNPTLEALIVTLSITLSLGISMIPYMFIDDTPVWHIIFYLPVSIVLVWLSYRGTLK